MGESRWRFHPVQLCAGGQWYVWLNGIAPVVLISGWTHMTGDGGDDSTALRIMSLRLMPRSFARSVSLTYSASVSRSETTRSLLTGPPQAAPVRGPPPSQ